MPYILNRYYKGFGATVLITKSAAGRSGLIISRITCLEQKSITYLLFVSFYPFDKTNRVSFHLVDLENSTGKQEETNFRLMSRQRDGQEGQRRI